MSASPAYLYTIVVEVLAADGNVSDVYRLKYGLRTVEVWPSRRQSPGQHRLTTDFLALLLHRPHR